MPKLVSLSRIGRPALALAAALSTLSAAPALAADAPADASAGKKVNINQASAAQIAYLPRVGNKVAERIVERRKLHGTYAQAEELMEVKGVGERLFQELKPYVTLTGPTTLTAKVRVPRSSTASSTRSSRDSRSSRSSRSSRPASSSPRTGASGPAAPSDAAPEGSGR